MITISILGLDQFVVGHYSREHTGNIAQLFECEEDAVNFYAPNSMVFHKGVEQTSWHTIVIVRAPSKYAPMEKGVADYLLKTLSNFSINIEVTFQYFEPGHRYEHTNNQYPRYIGEDNIDKGGEDVPFSFGEEPEHMEGDITCDCGHDHDHEHHHHDEKEEVYLGNAFEGFEEQLEEAEKKRSK